MWWSKSKPEAPKSFYERLPAYAPSETGRMLEAMQVDGFVLIPGVLQPSELLAARERIDCLEPIHWDFTGPTDHYKNVFNRDAFWLSFLDREGVIDLAQGSLG